MPHADEPFYKMKIGWAGDPKVLALGRFGALDACLGRDLFVQMINYARAELTDGLVPREAVVLAAYPLPADDADRVVRQLADPGPYGQLCQWDAARNAWRILAYARWNDTAVEVQARRANGRNAALHRWKAPDQRRDADGNASRNAGGNAVRNAGRTADRIAVASDSHTEVEVETESSAGVRDARTREDGDLAATQPGGDDELDQLIVAMLTVQGVTCDRQQAAGVRARILAGRNVPPGKRGAYIERALKTAEGAHKWAPPRPGGGAHGHPSASALDPVTAARAAQLRASYAGQDTLDDGEHEDRAHRGGDLARKLMAERPHADVISTAPDDGTAGLHGPALAAAQAEQSRRARLADVPAAPAEDDDDQADADEDQDHDDAGEPPF